MANYDQGAGARRQQEIVGLVGINYEVTEQKVAGLALQLLTRRRLREPSNCRLGEPRWILK